MTAPLIETEALQVRFGEVHAVRGVSLVVTRGESFGLVGESGSGKSTILRALVGLVAPSAGAMRLEGRPLGPKRDRALRRRMQMVFQDPYGSLHPRQTVDRHLSEALDVQRIGDAERRIRQVLDQVGLGPRFRFRYPHQLSGGQRQRVAIARALIVEPEILLLDEPTSALDVSVQAEVLNLLMALQREQGLTFIFVSHDLSVIATMCDRLAVMQAGLVVEEMTAADLATRTTRTSYARSLLEASEGYDPARAGRGAPPDAPDHPGRVATQASSPRGAE
jgi:peptide/nickel transport system ATP-binding protein